MKVYGANHCIAYALFQKYIQIDRQIKIIFCGNQHHATNVELNFWSWNISLSVQKHCCILSWVELLCPVQPQIYQHTHTHRCGGMFNEPDTHMLVRTHSDTLTNLEKAFLLTAVWFPLLYFLFSFLFSLCVYLFLAPVCRCGPCCRCSVSLSLSLWLSLSVSLSLFLSLFLPLPLWGYFGMMVIFFAFMHMFLFGLYVPHRYKNQLDSGYVPLWLLLPTYLIDQWLILKTEKVCCWKNGLTHISVKWMWDSGLALFSSLCGW